MWKVPDKKVASAVKWVMFLWAGLLLVRLFELQILQHDIFAKFKIRQSRTIKTIEPRRGSIYDRKGRVLAISVPAYSAYARKALTLQELERLRKALGLSKAQIQYMLKRWEKGDRFTWIKRKILGEEKRKIEALGIDKIGFLPDYKRVYPQGSLAAHILGGVGIDGKGLAGVELSLDKVLGGKPGKMEVLRDARGFPMDIKTLVPPTPGRDVYLSLDLEVQRVVEKSLFAQAKRRGAPRAAAVVLNLQGEVLAMASYPPYNPSLYSKEFARHPERLRNNAISMVYEPGSTVKFVDMAMALQEGKVRLSERINCGGGRIRIGKTVIRDHKPFSVLPLMDVLVHSSNVGIIRITQRIEDRVFYSYLKAFNLGEKTGIELPGEERGWIPRPELWRAATKAYFSIGQGFAVTPIQMAAAALAVASGGLWIRPHLLKTEVQARKVLSPEVAQKVAEMMVEVVRRGTGRKAYLSWIKVAGKTGTAEKIKGKLRAYTSSFVGFLPYPNPEFVVAVVVDEPKGQHYGGDVAAPVFRQIALGLCREVKLYPVVVR